MPCTQRSALFSVALLQDGAERCSAARLSPELEFGNVRL